MLDDPLYINWSARKRENDYRYEKSREIERKLLELDTHRYEGSYDVRSHTTSDYDLPVAGVALSGQPVEGKRLRIIETSRGGNSRIQWHRFTPGGSWENVLPDPDGHSYLCTSDDVGCTIHVSYTPISREGIEGIKKMLESDVVKPSIKTPIYNTSSKLSSNNSDRSIVDPSPRSDTTAITSVLKAPDCGSYFRYQEEENLSHPKVGPLVLVCVDGAGWLDVRADGSGRCSPFCRITFGSKIVETPPSQGSGNSAKWNFFTSIRTPLYGRLSVCAMDRLGTGAEELLGWSTVECEVLKPMLPFTVPLMPAGCIRLTLLPEGHPPPHYDPLDLKTNRETENPGVEGLKVTVVAGNGWTSENPNSQPFCRVDIGQVSQKSRAYLGGNLPAIWDQSLLFLSLPTTPTLRVSVLDANRGQDRLLGEGSIHLSQCKVGVPVRVHLMPSGWVQLTVSPIEAGTNATQNLNNNRAMDNGPSFRSTPSDAPEAKDVHIYVESSGVGAKVVSSFKYSGGRPGSHEHMWLQRRGHGETKVLQGNIGTDINGNSIYTIAPEDVGYEIRYAVLPVRDDGLEGTWTYSNWLPIAPSNIVQIDESNLNAGILTRAIVPPELVVMTNNEHKWIRVIANPHGEPLRQVVSLSETYTPTSHDVGHRLQYGFRVQGDSWILSPVTQNTVRPYDENAVPNLSSISLSRQSDRPPSLISAQSPPGSPTFAPTPIINTSVPGSPTLPTDRSRKSSISEPVQNLSRNDPRKGSNATSIDLLRRSSTKSAYQGGPYAEFLNKDAVYCLVPAYVKATGFINPKYLWELKDGDYGSWTNVGNKTDNYTPSIDDVNMLLRCTITDSKNRFVTDGEIVKLDPRMQATFLQRTSRALHSFSVKIPQEDERANLILTNQGFKLVLGSPDKQLVKAWDTTIYFERDLSDQESFYLVYTGGRKLMSAIFPMDRDSIIGTLRLFQSMSIKEVASPLIGEKMVTKWLAVVPRFLIPPSQNEVDSTSTSFQQAHNMLSAMLPAFAAATKTKSNP